MIDNESSLRPTFDSSRLNASALDEPGAVTPMLSPTRSFGDLYFAASSVVSPTTRPNELFCNAMDVIISPLDWR